MTDKEKLLALLKSFGVGYTEENGNVICEYGATKVDGYPGFCTIFEFDDSGAFITIGAWE